MTAAETFHETLLLERARDYVRRGFSVIPLESRGKRPTVAWKEFQSRRPTDEELVSWFSKPANLGVVTGAISGITVIDIDSDDAHQLAMKLNLPTSPMVRTSKGWHYYYAYERGVGNFQKRDDLPGIDLRGDGGYVVAPPSIHESGATYRWEGESRPFAELPKWILSPAQPSATVVRMPVSRLIEGANEGSRNESLARIIGSIASSTPADVAQQFALLWGTYRCSPSMDPREIERTVRSIYAREQNKQADLAGAGWSSEPTPEPETKPDVITVADLLDDIEHLYVHGLEPGVSTGWASLDGGLPGEHRLYSVRLGEWTLLTGIPGHGKSSWLDQLMVQIAENHDWKFGVFSAENLPIQRHVASLLEKYIDKPFNDGPTARISREDMKRALPWLNDRFFFVSPPEDRQNLRTLLDIGDRLISERGVSALVIDPWNELDHSRPTQQSETEYISIALSALRRFARSRKVHIFVVAHPAKMSKENGKYPVPTPYDVSGSAHWRNKADNAIAIYRNDTEPASNSVHVQKIRFRENGRVGVANLFYNNVTGRFTDLRWQ